MVGIRGMGVGGVGNQGLEVEVECADEGEEEAHAELVGLVDVGQDLHLVLQHLHRARGSEHDAPRRVGRVRAEEVQEEGGTWNCMRRRLSRETVLRSLLMRRLDSMVTCTHLPHTVAVDEEVRDVCAASGSLRGMFAPAEGQG